MPRLPRPTFQETLEDLIDEHMSRYARAQNPHMRHRCLDRADEVAVALKRLIHWDNL
jgi:hypothetical protein